MPKFPPNPPPDQKIRSLLTRMLIQKLSLLIFLLKKKEKKKNLIVEKSLPLSLRMEGCERLLGNQVQGGGDRDYLATLNTAQPCGVKGKEICEVPHFHDNQFPTPYFGGKKGEGPCLPGDSPSRLQVVVNRVRPGCGGRGHGGKPGWRGSPLTSWPFGLCD